MCLHLKKENRWKICIPRRIISTYSCFWTVLKTNYMLCTCMSSWRLSTCYLLDLTCVPGFFTRWERSQALCVTQSSFPLLVWGVLWFSFGPGSWQDHITSHCFAEAFLGSPFQSDTSVSLSYIFYFFHSSLWRFSDYLRLHLGVSSLGESSVSGYELSIIWRQNKPTIDIHQTDWKAEGEC